MTSDWQTQTAPLQDGNVQMVRMTHKNKPMSVGGALTALRDEPDFRMFLNNVLAQAPYPAFRFELPAVSAATADDPFEFVLVRDMTLASRPSRAAFAEHLDTLNPGAVAGFANLGGDAFMIVPCPLGSDDAYGHLAAFVRHAPREQQHTLWQLVGEATLLRLTDRPIWLSTAGGGVPWLHVRLDTRPKYYSFRPYTRYAP